MYRVVNLCLAIVGDSPVELEKIAVAAVFHDLGIWTNNTFDYIAPSVAIARKHLAARGMADWIPEIALWVGRAFAGIEGHEGSIGNRNGCHSLQPWSDNDTRRN